MSDRVEIFEVGPRDGLQNEAHAIATEKKVALVNMLSGAGFSRIEVASFVSPKWVPQMADSRHVLAQIERPPHVSFAALTPNLRGYEAAISANADEIAIFGSASEGFSRANLNKSRADAMTMFEPVCEAASAIGVPVRGYVSCVTHCPYDGPTPSAAVELVATRFLQMGCYEISLGDTIGAAAPADIDRLLSDVIPSVAADRLAGHFHDTHGRAIENVEVALNHGLRVFDAAAGGLGGCPFAPGAAGNLATERLASYLMREGLAPDLDLDAIEMAAEFAITLKGPADV